MIVETVTETRIRVDWAEVARQLEPKIMKQMRDAYDHWDDIGMRQMVVADAAAGLRICEYLAELRVDEVADALWDMDTAPREDVLYWIEEIAGEEAVKQIW